MQRPEGNVNTPADITLIIRSRMFIRSRGHHFRPTKLSRYAYQKNECDMYETYEEWTVIAFLWKDRLLKPSIEFFNKHLMFDTLRCLPTWIGLACKVFPTIHDEVHYTICEGVRTPEMQGNCQGEEISCGTRAVKYRRLRGDRCVEIAVPYPALIRRRPVACMSGNFRSQGETVSFSLQKSALVHGAFGREKEQKKNVKKRLYNGCQRGLKDRRCFVCSTQKIFLNSAKIQGPSLR